MNLHIAVFLSGFAMGIAPLFQVRAILRARSSAAVSLVWPLIIFVGCIIWLINGIELNDPAIIASEIIGIVTNSLTILLIVTFRNGPPAFLVREGELVFRMRMGQHDAVVVGMPERLSADFPFPQYDADGNEVGL
jgi:uncharacterized protein with PQ loop repeat